jgi:hypothetical protein
MQASTQTEPATAPAQPPAPVVTITTVGPGGTTQTLKVPSTQAEVEQLLTQRAELSEQLTSVTSRRRELSEEIRSAPEGASRTGLEERIRLLDQRILQLETDIAATGRQLSSAPSELVTFTERASQAGNGEWEEGLMVGGFSVLLLFPVALLYAKRRWKRKATIAPPQVQGEAAQRLERVEHAVEAIAIEIERVSEGQRFVTKLLSESPVQHGMSHRIAQTVPVEQDERASG